jgi:8-oxo-dGTP pyrophosphatase MutT (NUDIX family)
VASSRELRVQSIARPIAQRVRQFRSVGAASRLDDLRRALALLRAKSPSFVSAGRRAAVAGVLRETGDSAEMLFILRAEHPGDPWSGQMAWPGGRIDPGDAGPLVTAVRETREELALNLERDAELLGTLSEVRTHLRRGPGPLSVVPFVFALRGEPTLVPNREVQEAFWVPLSFFLTGRNRGRFVWTGRGVPLVMPCYRYNGRVIWGLTLRMLDELLSLFANANVRGAG